MTKMPDDTSSFDERYVWHWIFREIELRTVRIGSVPFQFVQRLLDLRILEIVLRNGHRPGYDRVFDFFADQRVGNRIYAINADLIWLLGDQSLHQSIFQLPYLGLARVKSDDFYDTHLVCNSQRRGGTFRRAVVRSEDTR